VKRLLVDSAAEPERREEPPRLVRGPGALLEPDDLWFPLAKGGPSRGCDREPATEIEDSSRRLALGSENRYDLSNQQEVKGAVETGEGGAFSRPVEDRSPVDSPALLHVDAGERHHTLPDLGERQGFPVALLDVADPAGGKHGKHFSAKVSMRTALADNRTGRVFSGASEVRGDRDPAANDASCPRGGA